MFLEGPGRAGHHALPELVDVPSDRVVIKAAAAEFEDGPLELALSLPPEQGRGQIPRGRRRQRTGHLLPHLAAAVPFELPFELLADRGPQGISRIEATELFQERGRHLGEFQPLHVQDLEFHRHVLATDVLDGGLIGQPDRRRDRRARLGLGHERRKSGQFGIGKRELVANDDLGLVGLRQYAVVVFEDQAGDDQVTGRGRTVVRHEAGPLAKVAGECLVDVGLGNLAGWPGDRQPLPGGQIELRSDLDRELERHRTVVGEQHRVGVEIRLADRRQFLLLRDLGHGVGQQFRADLIGEFRLEATAHQPSRGTARTEARQERRGHEFTDRLVAVAVDVLPRDRHLHPPLAGGDSVDRNVEAQRLREPVGALRRGDGIWGGGRGCIGR